jgi:hypothetical protein
MSASALIVLAGGGLAQIESSTGCLMALHDLGLPVRDAGKVHWRGTSAGAIVAAVVNAGWSPERIASYLVGRDTGDLVARRWWWPIRALCGGPIYQRDGAKNFLLETLWDDSILPNVTVIMTRLKGLARVEAPASFNTVMASSAIDGIFGPWPIGGELFLDGGYTDNVPLDPWHVGYYDRVFLILPPLDVDHARHARTYIGRLLDGFDLKLLQEVNEAERIYGDADRWPTVTVLRPPPIESSLLALSPDRRVLRHAYDWTLSRLTANDCIIN